VRRVSLIDATEAVHVMMPMRAKFENNSRGGFMRLLKIVVLTVVVFVAVFGAYAGMPKQYKYAISDWYARIGAPPFIDAPDYFSAENQNDVIRALEAKNFKLICTGGLYREEKISETDDYECHSFINSSYDNIPTKLVSLFFSKNKLTHVRLEFPDTSFDKINDYLNRKLASYPRLDRMPGHHINPDNYGKPMQVWVVRHGMVSMSGEGTPNRNLVLLWASYPPEVIQRLNP
jgi:hypothetical protein